MQLRIVGSNYSKTTEGRNYKQRWLRIFTTEQKRSVWLSVRENFIILNSVSLIYMYQSYSSQNPPLAGRT